MDIMVSHQGIIRHKPDGSEDHIEVELPIHFTSAATGPAGIIDLVVKSMRVDAVDFGPLGDPTLHGLSPQKSSPKSLKGALINERPVKFRPDEQGGNILVIAFEADGKEVSREAFSKGASQNVEIEMYLLFSNLARLTVIVKGERISASGVFVPKEVVRATTPFLIDANLVALGAIAGFLVLWNTWLNANVHEQTYAFSQTMIVGITGSLLTFLGLSLGQLRAWLAALTETLSVLRYPELHVNSTLLRLLSSPGWSVVLGMVAIFSGWVVLWNWSEAKPNLKGLAVYDTVSKEIVLADRIYRRHLKQERRFALVCASQDKDVRRLTALAYIKPWGEIEDVRFQANYRRDISEASSVTMEHTGREWLESISIPDDFQVVQAALCTPRDSEPILSSNRMLLFTDTGDPLRQELLISRQRIWELEDVSIWAEDFKDTFRSLDFEPLFNERVDLVSRYEGKLKEKIGEKGVVPFDVIHALTRLQLSEITSQKRAIERSILLRGLWRATSEKRSRLPEKAELIALAQHFEPLLAGNLGWKAERALLELMLEIQVQNPSVAGSIFHEAVVASWMKAHRPDRFVRLCDYLTVAVALNAVGEPQRNFLVENWREFRLWAGAEGPLTDWLLKREESERRDPFVSRSFIHEQLKVLEAGLNFESNMNTRRG